MPTITISNQRREDMIVGALEGGSNYWYFLPDTAVKAIKDATPEMKKEPLSIRMWKAIDKGATIQIFDADNESEKLGEINLSSVEKGEQIMADQHPYHFANLISENDDATTADVWFQCCVLSEVVYG